jgi:hypothetical protein
MGVVQRVDCQIFSLIPSANHSCRSPTIYIARRFRPPLLRASTDTLERRTCAHVVPPGPYDTVHHWPSYDLITKPGYSIRSTISRNRFSPGPS